MLFTIVTKLKTIVTVVTVVKAETLKIVKTEERVIPMLTRVTKEPVVTVVKIATVVVAVKVHNCFRPVLLNS